MEKAQDLPKQPLAEVFGYPIDNFSQAAERHRRLHLCPFNNKVPNCTKSRVENPIGVCSVYDASQTATVTCPIRFREDWYIVEHAASFFFPQGVNFTSLTEVKLNDKYGKSAGNIDTVLVSYDDVGRLKDFGSLEVQAVYTSGTISAPFKQYITDPLRTLILTGENIKTIRVQIISHHLVNDLLRNSSIRAESSMLGKRRWLWQ